jgi:hypothetical protein
LSDMVTAAFFDMRFSSTGAPCILIAAVVEHG